MVSRVAWFYAMILVVCCSAPADAAQSTRVNYINAPLNNQPWRKIWAELKTPDGNGPFPIVLVLQACGGLDDSVTTDWPKFLNELGYAALVVDILGSRNVESECASSTIPLDERMRDIYGTLAFLGQQPNIDATRIYAIGFSWGGSHVLEMLLERRLAQFGLSQSAAFKGGVAVYPDCKGIAGAVTERNVKPAFYAPALIVAAELDDWTPVTQCQTIITGQRQPPVVRMEVMPAAHHGFDQFTSRGQMLTSRKVFGHTMAPNRAATDKARALVKDFLRSQQ